MWLSPLAFQLQRHVLYSPETVIHDSVSVPQVCHQVTHGLDPIRICRSGASWKTHHGGQRSHISSVCLLGASHAQGCDPLLQCFSLKIAWAVCRFLIPHSPNTQTDTVGPWSEIQYGKLNNKWNPVLYHDGPNDRVVHKGAAFYQTTLHLFMDQGVVTEGM